MVAAQGGDRDALDQLLREHYDRVYAVCRRITGNDSDAADATQEAMIAIVRGLARFDQRATFSTWAYRIASNCSLDELRRRRRRPLLAVADPRQPARVSGDPLQVADPRSESVLDSVDDRLQLDDALAELATDFRVAVVLRDVADLDYAEIASVLDLPIGTVKSRIARGRAALASKLRPAAGNHITVGDVQAEDP
ncbi:MAG: sigma-70 family RNA polymerase sigma factor [Ilumatobacteraceae bacterium]